MPAHSPPSPSLIPAKRPRQISPDNNSPPTSAAATTTAAGALPPTESSAGEAASSGAGTGSGSGSVFGHSSGPGNGDGTPTAGLGAKPGQSSNFRNVSACNRCRLRKNRCDQRLPSCVSCEKAGVACVGYDPITKREIPRSYVYYLETRVEQLEGLLQANDIAFPPADELEHSSTVRSPTDAARSVQSEQLDSGSGSGNGSGNGNGGGGGGGASGNGSGLGTVAAGGNNGSSAGRNGLSNSSAENGARAMAAGSRSQRTADRPGMSFARVVFAAVQSSVSDQKSVSDKGSVHPYKPIAGNGSVSTGTSMRDSFFGLHTKPTISPALFPDRELGQRLVSLYFEHANPQIPVLHREDFMQMFDLAYSDAAHGRGPKELYMLNMVFAIGGGIIMGDLAKPEPLNGNGAGRHHGPDGGANDSSCEHSGDQTRQCQPEEYHASAIIHLEACLSNSGGGLEELQAVLLLANFALLRPVPPGLWYIVGVAVRLAVDLGLYYEDGKDVDAGLSNSSALPTEARDRERGRREYVRDLRRRLWWCTYSFDRLVSVCVGRPPGVPDQVMTTEFPSLLDDRYITASGFLRKEHDPAEPSYKRAAHHYFRLRLLQSEIIQVLQFQQAQMARATSGSRPFAEGKPFMNYDLPCPYLANFDSFRSWRIDIDRRLYKWKTSVPPKSENGVAFSTDFLVLNYWQAIIMLYRQSLSVPTVFEGEYHTSKEVNSPTTYRSELREDEDRVYLKVAEAGQRILRLYRQLHLAGLVNYTYLATHHLFMAGISYLYAIWHSPIVRSRLTMDEVDFTILAATSVFSDLIDKCPPAEACRDAFDRTAKATIKMANANGGFGQQALGHGHRSRQRSSSKSSMENQRVDWAYSPNTDEPTPTPNSGHRHHAPQLLHIDTMESDAFVTSAPSSSQLLGRGGAGSRPYRMTGGGNTAGVKMEGDGFSLMQNAPGVPRSNASSGELAGTPDGSASIMDQGSILASPTIGGQAAVSPSGAGRPLHVSPMQTSMQGTPPSSIMSMQQQQLLTQQNVASVYTPSSQAYSELQGMDFLQNFGGSGVGGDQMFGGNGFSTEPPMDMGLGFGWEGMHHDFNDGQQLDLFDGFFFGGQQGGGGV